jgi:hypothetical protein
LQEPDMVAYQRGLKEGALIARVDGVEASIKRINGSIERHADSVDALARIVNAGLEKVTGEIRKMQVDAQLRDAAVKVAADTLAVETERRRAALADEGGRWSLRANKWNVVSGFLAIVFAAATLYLSLH